MTLRAPAPVRYPSADAMRTQEIIRSFISIPQSFSKSLSQIQRSQQRTIRFQTSAQALRELLLLRCVAVRETTMLVLSAVLLGLVAATAEGSACWSVLPLFFDSSGLHPWSQVSWLRAQARSDRFLPHRPLG